MQWGLVKGVAIHCSLTFSKVDVRNQGLAVGRDPDIDFTNWDFIKYIIVDKILKINKNMHLNSLVHDIGHLTLWSK